MRILGGRGVSWGGGWKGGREGGRYVLAGERAVGCAVDGAWVGGVGEDWLLMRGARQGLPVWPVSLVTRRLGKVITWLCGGGGARMDLGGERSALALGM